MTILIGLYVYELMAFFAGLKGQPVDIYKFFGGTGVDGFNLVASIAAFVVAIGVFLELGNAAYSYRDGVRVGHDPWGGATLEWFALSPRRSTTSTRFPTCGAPSRSTTSAGRSASGPRAGARPRRPRRPSPRPSEAQPVEAGGEGAAEDHDGGPSVA